MPQEQAKPKEKRLEQELLQTLMDYSPVREVGGESKRAKVWRGVLRNLPDDERKQMIAERKAYAKDRKEWISKVTEAVDAAREEIPEFKGVVLTAGFTEAKENTGDIDAIAVFAPGEKNLLGLLMGVNKYMVDHFPHPNKAYREGLTRGKARPMAIIHFGQIAAINIEKPESLESWSKSETTSLWNFIGDPKTKETLLQAMKKHGRI